MGDQENKEITGISNDVRGFMVYSNLYNILEDYIKWGDGFHSIAVYDEDMYTDTELVDATVINLMKLLSTAYGLAHLDDAVAIVNAIHKDGILKRAVRFRSRHPLFVEGTPLYQNICLVSGMIQMNIPILPYYNGQDVLVDNIDGFDFNIEHLRVDGEMDE